MSDGSANGDRSLVVTALAWAVAVNIGAFAAAPIADALSILTIVPALAVAVAWIALLLRAAGVIGRRMVGKQSLGWAPHVIAGLVLVGVIGYAGEWRWLAERGDALFERRRLAAEVERYGKIVADLRAGRIEMPARLSVTEQIRGVTYSVLSTDPLRVAFLEPVGYVEDPTAWTVYDPTAAVLNKGAVPPPTRLAGDYSGCERIAPAYFWCWTN